MFWVVDRIEGSLAVLEGDGGTLEKPLSELPAGVAEGWVLRADFQRDEAEERRREDAVTERFDALASDDDGGDFSL